MCYLDLADLIRGKTWLNMTSLKSKELPDRKYLVGDINSCGIYSVLLLAWWLESHSCDVYSEIRKNVSESCSVHHISSDNCIAKWHLGSALRVKTKARNSPLIMKLYFPFCKLQSRLNHRFWQVWTFAASSPSDPYSGM